jgi:hypothetical protein
MTAPSHGHAKTLDGGSIQITFAYHNADQAIPKAGQDTLLQQPASLSIDVTGENGKRYHRFKTSQPELRRDWRC